MQLGNESETELQQNKEHFVVLYTKKKEITTSYERNLEAFPNASVCNKYQGISTK